MDSNKGDSIRWVIMYKGDSNGGNSMLLSNTKHSNNDSNDNDNSNNKNSIVMIIVLKLMIKMIDIGKIMKLYVCNCMYTFRKWHPLGAIVSEVK